MFWGRTLSLIAIAGALGVTLSDFTMGSMPAKAADLGGDCCADLEERVAELEMTTIRKGNKKVSITLSGWILKMEAWWNDGHESGLYWGDAEARLSSHFQISGGAQVAPGWSAGYALYVETPGNSAAAGITENQFNDNSWIFSPATLNTLQSFMWIKSEKWGTLNWGQLMQATDAVAVLPDLSGTIYESNVDMYNGPGMFIRPSGAKNATDLATDFTWGNVLACLNRDGIGADCNGYNENAVRYDAPTFAGFSLSTSYGEDDMWDVAVRYAADWGNFKVSAAYGFASVTDEGCVQPGVCTNIPFIGGGGAPFQGFRKDVEIHQVGASVMHVPSGFWAYGYYEQENNNGTKYLGPASAANNTETWFIKAGIQRAWTPFGATVIWGEGGQYLDEFTGLCGPRSTNIIIVRTPNVNPTCVASINTSPVDAGGNPTVELVNVTGSTVNRWGVGIVQMIDSAAMHLFFRWQHLNLDLDTTLVGTNVKAKSRFDDLDLWLGGGVIFF
jgi:predicted porin